MTDIPPAYRRFVVPGWLARVLSIDGIICLMEAQGFRFISTACPVKLASPNRVSHDDTAQTTTYEQWETVHG